MRANDFDYSKLPYEQIVDEYEGGVSWRELARRYGCPDHKSLMANVKLRFPKLEVRNHAEAQRARRDREGTSRRKKGKNEKRPWWSRKETE